MPSTVISVLLSYNEYFQLGIPRSEVFIDPTLSHIDEWILSKRYTSQEIDERVGSNALSSFITPPMLDLNSDLSKRYMAALEKDNLSKGWSPRKGEKVLLVHNVSDATVPVANAENMYKFFQSQGLNVSTNKADNPDILVRIEDMGQIPGTLNAHNMGALIFVGESLSIVCDILQIPLWLHVMPDIFG